MTEPNNKYIDPVSRTLDPRFRDIEPTDGDLGFSSAMVRNVDVSNRTVTAIVSTPNVDRYEEIVEPKAFAKWLDVFKANPVFIAGHSYSGWSGEPTCIGHWLDMKITDEGLVGTAKFADTALAEEYWKLYQGGHMKAFSVGWITHEWEVREYEVAPGVKKKIRVFTEVELIEVSAVSIPANRECLIRAASALAGQPGGPHDAEQSAAIAKAMNEKIDAAVEAACAKHVPSAIQKQLSTEPGMAMCTLLQDFAEMLAANPTHGGNASEVPPGGKAAPKADSFEAEISGVFASD